MLTRDAGTGILTFRHAERPENAINLTNIMTSPDDRHVYVAGDTPASGSVLGYTTTPLCPSTPQMTCRDPGKSLLLLKAFTDASKNKLVYKWLKGEQTDFTAYGDPFNGTTAYALCLYAEGMSGQELRLDANAPAPAFCNTSNFECWQLLGEFVDPKGVLYRDSARSPDGILKVLLKPGATGAAKVLVIARGALLPPPPALPLGLPLTVQVMHSDGECWSSTFTSSDVDQAPGDPAVLKGLVAP